MASVQVIRSAAAPRAAYKDASLPSDCRSSSSSSSSSHLPTSRRPSFNCGRSDISQQRRPRSNAEERKRRLPSAVLRTLAAVSVLLAQPTPVAEAIDGQSGKLGEDEAERIYNDPNCDRTAGTEQGVDWFAIREQLLSVPFPQSMAAIGPVIDRLQLTSEFDREAGICPFGMVSVMFFFVKFLLESKTPDMTSARVWMSLLDAVASGMHPHLLDSADWLVKDSRLIALRRVMLRRLREEEVLKQALAAKEKEVVEEAAPKKPRIFVYGKEVEHVIALTQGASFCGKGQWGMEVHIHEWLLASTHLVADPEEADLFFVPAYSICMFEAGFHSIPALDLIYKDMVQNLPYFRRNNGRDHIFTFGSGMSANVFRSWRSEIGDSIFLTPETWLFNDFPNERKPCFNTWKDIAIPGHLHRHEILSLAGQARSLKKREHVAVFLGRTDPSRGPHPAMAEADVRGSIRRLHEQGKVFVAQNLSMGDMHSVMGNAKFCFVPKGKSAWSLRFYEALFANCIPVVLSDFWELPFEHFLDVSSFVIKWPMSNVGDELLDYLGSLPDNLVEELMASGRQHRCWYVYPPLIHEVDVDIRVDQLYKLCPNLREANAYTGIMRLLERKQRASWSMRRFFAPGWDGPTHTWE